MNNQEQTLARFREYAREMIDTHTSQIREKYNKEAVQGEVRLQIYNEHLDELKQQLQTKMRELSMKYSNEVGGDGRLIATRLNTVYNNNINEFFKTEF